MTALSSFCHVLRIFYARYKCKIMNLLNQPNKIQRSEVVQCSKLPPQETIISLRKCLSHLENPKHLTGATTAVGLWALQKIMLELCFKVEIKWPSALIQNLDRFDFKFLWGVRKTKIIDKMMKIYYTFWHNKSTTDQTSTPTTWHLTLHETLTLICLSVYLSCPHSLLRLHRAPQSFLPPFFPLLFPFSLLLPSSLPPLLWTFLSSSFL